MHYFLFYTILMWGDHMVSQNKASFSWWCLCFINVFFSIDCCNGHTCGWKNNILSLSMLGHIPILWMWFWLCLLQYISTSFFYVINIDFLYVKQTVMDHLVFLYFVSFFQFVPSLCLKRVALCSGEKYCNLQKSLLFRVRERLIAVSLWCSYDS